MNSMRKYLIIFIIFYFFSQNLAERFETEDVMLEGSTAESRIVYQTNSLQVIFLFILIYFILEK